MNAIVAHRWLVVLFGCLIGLPISADYANAAEMGMPFLQANLVYEFAADRARMIQISLVIVALGCACLWWRR